MVKRIKKWHWDRQHRKWTKREQRFVAELLHYLGSADVLYVHPVEGGPATIEVRPIRHDDNHNHVEGAP